MAQAGVSEAVRRASAAPLPAAASGSGEDDWPRDAAMYELKHVIGEGAFAKVFLARCRPKRTDVAIKVMKLEELAVSLEDIRQEVTTMRMCNHPNVLSCHCCFTHGPELWLVMPYMEYGSCLRILRHLQRSGRIAEGEGFSEDAIGSVLAQTLHGLQYLHKAGWIHRDVKAGNVLVSSSGEVKIADFGVAGLMMDGERRSTCKTFVGTPCWMAPEVIEKQQGYSEKADIWSLGITALEMAKGYAPYAQHHAMKVLLLILKEDPPSLKSYKDENPRRMNQLTNFCKKTLIKDPKMRLTASELLHKATLVSKAKPVATTLMGLLRDVPTLSEGAPEIASGQRLPGHTPVSREELAAMQGAEAGGAGESAEGEHVPSATLQRMLAEERVRGTTWVDPSGVWTTGGSKDAADGEGESSKPVDFNSMLPSTE